MSPKREFSVQEAQQMGDSPSIDRAKVRRDEFRTGLGVERSMSTSESTYHADGPLAGRSFVCTICGYSSQDLADTQAHLRGIHEVEDPEQLSQEEQGGLITRYSGEELVVDVPKWLTDHETPATVYSSAMHYHVQASLEAAACNLASLEPITWPDWVEFLLAELERQCPAEYDFRDILLRVRELIEKRVGI